MACDGDFSPIHFRQSVQIIDRSETPVSPPHQSGEIIFPGPYPAIIFGVVSAVRARIHTSDVSASNCDLCPFPVIPLCHKYLKGTITRTKQQYQILPCLLPPSKPSP